MPSEPKAFHQFNIKSQSVTKAIGLNAIFYGAQDLLQLITMLILVRILLPEDYAIFTLVLSTHGLIGAFAHQSFIAHSLQVDSKQKINYDIYMTFSGFIQFFCFCVCNVVAFFYEGSGDIKNLSLFLHVLSFTFLVEWFTELIFKVYERNESWQRRRILHLIASASLSAVSIFLAVFGFGIWSLIIPTLLQQVIFLYDLFVHHQWRFRWSIDWKEYKAAWIFGWHRIGSLLLQRLRVWIEPWLLIQFLVLADLGIYTRGLGLAQLLIYRISVTVMLTLFPYIAKLRTSAQETCATNNKLLFYLLLLLVPLSIGLACYAPFVTSLLYGGGWGGVANILLPLGFICAMNGLIHALSQLSLANQNVRVPVWIDAILLVVHISPLLISAYFSMEGYLMILLLGYSVCLFSVILLFDFYFHILNSKYLGVVFLKIVCCCLPIIIYTQISPPDFAVSLKSFIEIAVLVYLYMLSARFVFFNELEDLIKKLSKYRVSVLFII